MVWFPSKQHYFILKASAIWQISKVSVSVCIQCEHLLKAHTAHIHTHTQAPATNRASNISHLMEFLTQTFESFPFQFAQFPNGISPFNRKLNKKKMIQRHCFRFQNVEITAVKRRDVVNCICLMRIYRYYIINACIRAIYLRIDLTK